jgi:glycosyltransferase involved in cell wall biosynthesis
VQLCGPPFCAATCAQCLGEEKRRYRIPGRVAPGLARALWKRQTGRIARVQERMDTLRRALDGVRVVISPSRFLRGLFVEAGVVPEKIVFCRQGRDFAGLGPGDLAKTPSRLLRIGYMGQIAPHKGIHTLFKAVQLLPNVELEVKVFGDATRFPDYARRLRRMADGDSRLKLAGLYEQTEVSRVLQEIDVVVVPSIWYENSPNTILEAFAHRTPVVVSDLGGMTELVEDGTNGLVFEPNNVSSLADALGRIARDDGLLKRLSRGCKPVKPVAEEMDELLVIYRSLLSN